MHSGSYLKMAVLHTLWSGKVVHLNMLFRPSVFRNAIFWNSRCIAQQIMYHDNEKKKMYRKVRLVYKCRTLRIPSVCMSAFNDSPDISILVSLIFYVSFPYQTLIFPLVAEFSAQLLPTIITVIKRHPYSQ